MDLRRDIENVLVSGGISFRSESFAGVPSLVCNLADGSEKVILPIEISAGNLSDAVSQQALMLQAIEAVKAGKIDEAGNSGNPACQDEMHCHESYGKPPVIITEDRWFRNRETMSRRLLAHLGVFESIFARNCKVEKISASLAASFLEDTHSYGDAKSRYHYGIFHKGELVAVAEFSNPRRWHKTVRRNPPSTSAERLITSYEWVRYASLPGMRVIGGMGKVLKHFIGERHPDDIMSYADLEWSEGAVYQSLGFKEEGFRKPVAFEISPDWQRHAIHLSCANESDNLSGPSSTSGPDEKHESIGTNKKYFLNFGSVKYRLKLIDYK